MGYCENRIRVLTKHHRTWLQKQSDLEAKELLYLDEDLKDGSLRAFPNISTSLSMIADAYGIRGIIESMGQLDSGTRDISLALSYHYWSLKFEAAGLVQRFSAKS